jgi:hypothetical protein
MDVIGFLYVSLGIGTVQLHDSIGTRRACTYSEAGFSSQNGDRASGVYYRRAAICCAFFCGQKDSIQKDVHKEIFPVHCGKCLSRKPVHNWIEKLYQGLSTAADDARPGHPVEIVTEVTVQRVE